MRFTPVASAKAGWRMLLVTLVLPVCPHQAGCLTWGPVGTCVSAGKVGNNGSLLLGLLLLFFFFLRESKGGCCKAATNSGFVHLKGESLTLLRILQLQCQERGHHGVIEEETEAHHLLVLTAA